MKKYVSIICCIVALCITPVYAESENYWQDTVSSWENGYVIKTDGSLYEINMDTDDYVSKKLMEKTVSVTRGIVLMEDGTVRKINDNEMIMEDAIAVSSIGTDHALIIKNDHTLWGFGDNSSGQLAQGTMDKTVEEQLKENLRHRNKTSCAPIEYDEPVKIMEGVKSAITDGAKSIVLKEDGTVWTFGYDYDGTLGQGYRYIVNNVPTKILSNIKQIFAEGESCFAIDNDDVLWRWGSIYTGYFGGSEDLFIKTPQKYVENVSLATNVPGYNLVVKNNGELWVYGNTDADGGIMADTPLKLLDNVVAVHYLGEEYNADDSFREKILVIKENHDLMLMYIPDEGSTEQIEYKKIMSNVRLPNELPANVNFVDTSNETEETQKSINSLAKAGIINGVSETEFAPDKTLTRAEVAAMLLRLSAIEEDTSNGGFADVTQDDWYYGVAGASKKYGIVNGFEDNTFRGDEEISKLQFVALAARTLESEKGEMESAAVSLDVPEWAEEDISLAITFGLVAESESFNGSITRGEAAVILYRLYDRI